MTDERTSEEFWIEKIDEAVGNDGVHYDMEEAFRQQVEMMRRNFVRKFVTYLDDLADGYADGISQENRTVFVQEWAEVFEEQLQETLKELSRD